MAIKTHIRRRVNNRKKEEIDIEDVFSLKFDPDDLIFFEEDNVWKKVKDLPAEFFIKPGPPPLLPSEDIHVEEEKGTEVGQEDEAEIVKDNGSNVQIAGEEKSKEPGRSNLLVVLMVILFALIMVVYAVYEPPVISEHSSESMMEYSTEEEALYIKNVRVNSISNVVVTNSKTIIYFVINNSMPNGYKVYLRKNFYLRYGNTVIPVSEIEGISLDSESPTHIQPGDSLNYSVAFHENIPSGAVVDLIEATDDFSIDPSGFSFFDVNLKKPHTAIALMAMTDERRSEFINRYSANHKKLVISYASTKRELYHVYIDKKNVGSFYSYSDEYAKIPHLILDLPPGNTESLIEESSTGNINRLFFNISDSPVYSVEISKYADNFTTPNYEKEDIIISLPKRKYFEKRQYFAPNFLVVDSDLESYSLEDIQILINHAYARKGLIFRDKKRNDYFMSKDWYLPKSSDQNYISSTFTEYEKVNLDFVANYREKLK